MRFNLDIIGRLSALLDGTLKGKEKKALLKELQDDVELSDMLHILQKINDIAPRDSKKINSAAKKLSKTLYLDFLKEQSTIGKQVGVQIYDSALLPLPEGVRPASVDTRTLKYHLGDTIVELTVYPITIDSVEIIGQLHGIDKKQKISVTAQSKDKSQKVDVDKYCLFRFDRVPSGHCQLLFSCENSEEGIIELSL